MLVVGRFIWFHSSAVPSGLGTALGLAFSYIGVRISEHHIVYAMSIEV